MEEEMKKVFFDSKKAQNTMVRGEVHMFTMKKNSSAQSIIK